MKTEKELNYDRVHQWLKHNFKKPKKCENKKCKGRGKRLEYALIKGNSYEKKRENFMVLCASCHRSYDFTEEMRKRISERFRGNTNQRKSILMLDMDNNIIAEFPSITLAALKTGMKIASISLVASGNRKSLHGYKWKFKQI